MSVWGVPVLLGGGGSSPNIQQLSVIQNGTYTASGGVDGFSPVVVNVPGGGTTVYAFIAVNYAPGAICTATKGATTLTAPDTSGVVVFAIPEAGTWTVAQEGSGIETAQEMVSVTEYGQRFEVDLLSTIEDVQAFGGRVVVKEVWNASHTYKALKWYFCGVSVTSTSGNGFTEPLLSLRPANNRPNGHAWNAKCYPNKGSYSGDLCIYGGMLRYIFTPTHSAWITGSDLYSILYLAHPDYASSFSETDFTTLGGAEGDTQQNEWEEP